jgi:hypothetical protein
MTRPRLGYCGGRRRPRPTVDLSREAAVLLTRYPVACSWDPQARAVRVVLDADLTGNQRTSIVAHAAAELTGAGWSVVADRSDLLASPKRRAA